MTAKSFKFCAPFALAAVLSAVVGCTDKASPDNVDRRAVERWNYLIARQAEKAYDYLSPGYRETKTRESYADAMNNRPVKWMEAKFKRKTCDGDSCQVIVEVKYSVAVGGAPAMESNSDQSETWIRVDGDWYFLPK